MRVARGRAGGNEEEENGGQSGMGYSEWREKVS